MAANLLPITSDGGFTSGGNINSSGDSSASPSLNDFFSITSAANFAIVTDNANTDQTWTFDDLGNLTLPGNTFAVNYANGTQVSIGGGGANTGNVTFSDQIVIGTGSNDGSGGLYLAPGNNSIANSALQYLRVRGGDVVTHIHLDTGNNAFYDQYFGNDAKYVKLEAGDAGNVVIGTDDANGNQYSWSFTSDGNLILAGGDSVIQSIANSSLDPNNANVSTMVFTPDQNYTSQSLVIDPTGPSHIHLRAPGANIDEPDANIFLGGEESSFEVGYYNGAAPNLFIHSNNNTWTFDTAGTLVFPRDTGPNTTDPILNIIGGANPTITSTDASLAGPANLGISALNTIFTGFTGDAIKIYPDDGEISSTANLQIWANSGGNTEYSWTFDTTGNLTLPDTTSVLANVSITLEANDTGNITGLNVIGDSHANLYAHGNITLYANTGGAGSTWTFGTNGALTLPQGSQISETANTSVNITANANTWAFGVDGNLTVPGSLINDTSIVLSAPAIFNICTIATAGSGYNTGSSLKATTGGSGTGMTVGIGYGLSNQLTSVSVVNPGTGYVNGDVITVSEGTGGTFVITKYNVLANQTNNNTVQTDLIFANNTLTIPVDGNLVGNLIVPGSIVSSGASPAPYISGFSSISALTLNAPTLTNGNSNVTVNANSNLWTFDSTGNLTLPGNTFAVNYANGTQVPVGVTQDITSNGAMSIMLYDGNIKYNNYATVEPSTGNIAGGNISTTGVVTANIANITTGNITTINSGLLQNGNSNITLTANGNVSIQAAGSNVELVVTSTGANITGTLNATGTVTGSYLISTQASGNEGGEISLAQPPNGNLSGGITIDAYQNTLRMFEQGGTARGLSVDIANSPAGGGTAIGYRDIPQVAAGNVTLAATDAGKHYYSTTAGNLTLTIPLNSTVPFTTGTAISIVVQAAGNILVNAASGVTLYMAGNSTAANRVVGGYGMATLMKVASDTWFINGAGVA